MPVYVKISGVWTRVTTGYAKVGGAWLPGEWYVKVGGLWRNASAAIPHDTTVTSGSFNDPYSGSVTWGYDPGIPIGSIADSTYEDSVGTIRTIESVTGTTQAGGVGPYTYIFTLAANAPNTDETFQSLLVNGNQLWRASAAFSGSRSWVWADVNTVLFPISGAWQLKVLFSEEQT